MTEEVQAVVQDSAPQEPVTPVTETQVAAPAEKMVPQSEVNKLVGGAKQKGYDRAQEELRNLQAQQAHQQQQVKQAPSLGGIDQTQVQEIVKQQMQALQQQQYEQQQQQYYNSEASRILQEMGPKTEDAKGRYSDYEDTLGSVDNFRAAPDMWQYANMVDNGGDVLYDIAKNPSKIATIRQLAAIDPNYAATEIQRLSNSIKQNQNGANSNVAPEPLRQVKSSNVGVGDGGPKSIADFKKMYY